MCFTIKTDHVANGKKDVDPHRLFTGGSGVNGLSPTVGRLFECPGSPLCICSFSKKMTHTLGWGGGWGGGGLLGMGTLGKVKKVKAYMSQRPKWPKWLELNLVLLE